MVVVVAKNFIKKDKLEENMKLSKELIKETRKEEGCISYELHQDLEDETILTFIEKWESREHLQAHFESQHFKKLVPLLGETQSKETELNMYTRLSI